MEVTISSKNNCYRIDPQMLRRLQDETSLKTTLEQGVYRIKIKSGTFSYSQDTSTGVPFAHLWIYGKFINKKDKCEVPASWVTIHGTDDILTLEVLETTNVCGFFFDTNPQDNSGEVTLSIVRVGESRVVLQEVEKVETLKVKETIPEPEYKFDPVTTEYSSHNAYWLAKAAKLAYLKTSDKDQTPDHKKILEELKFCDSRFSDVKPFDNKSSQAFVARHEDIIIASFRGTNEILDWLDNLNFLHVELPIGRVHKGFYDGLRDIWSPMEETIAQYRDNGQSLWITGHSLGGALAALAAVDLVEKDKFFNGVYTFGQPRCCDRSVSRIMNIEVKPKIFRFHHQNDIVPRIPQRLMGYSHLGTFIYIDKDKKLSANPNLWYQFTDRLQGTWDDLREKGIEYIKDHDMNNYLTALRLGLDKKVKGL